MLGRNAEFIPLWLGDLAIWRNKLRAPTQHYPSHPDEYEMRTGMIRDDFGTGWEGRTMVRGDSSASYKEGMSSLATIPAAPARRWQQFRTRVLPFVIFGSVLLWVGALWRNAVVTLSLVGEVEPVRISVSSPKAGVLTELSVGRFQRVRAGEIIAQVSTVQPEVRQASLAVLEAELQALRDNAHPVLGQEALEASIRVQDAKLRLTESEQVPLILTAPMDGTVSVVHHQSGETLLAGDPIVTLSAVTSDRIIGYVPPSLTVSPQVGMPVQVRVRSLPRVVRRAEIVGIGNELQLVTDAQFSGQHEHLPALGLAIEVSLPAGQKLLPGELVDLVLLPERN
jgi:multidrug efflux pump subunit AcrA (membrane-fusion protein)